jgi:hypothetical protein
MAAIPGKAFYDRGAKADRQLSSEKAEKRPFNG